VVNNKDHHLQTLDHIHLSDNLCPMAPVDLLGLPTIFNQVLEATDQLAARQAAIHQGAFADTLAPHHLCKGPDPLGRLGVLLGLQCLEMFLDTTRQLSEQPTWREQSSWLLSKEKRRQGSRRWQLGCSRCKWRGKIQEQT